MSRYTGDLEALVAFREHLIQFSQTLSEDYATLRQRWGALGEVWTDEKYFEFGAALDEVAPGIERYLAATDGHEAHLLRLIQIIEDYSGTRPG
jgi:hypothetical protein